MKLVGLTNEEGAFLKDGLIHRGSHGIMPGTWFRFCAQNARGVMHQEDRGEHVPNGVPTCLRCIALTP